MFAIGFLEVFVTGVELAGGEIELGKVVGADGRDLDRISENAAEGGARVVKLALGGEAANLNALHNKIVAGVGAYVVGLALGLIEFGLQHVERDPVFVCGKEARIKLNDAVELGIGIGEATRVEVSVGEVATDHG